MYVCLLVNSILFRKMFDRKKGRVAGLPGILHDAFLLKLRSGHLTVLVETI